MRKTVLLTASMAAAVLVAVLKRYVEAHDRERSERQHASRFSFRAHLTGDGAGAIEFVGA